jgi:hypothetical protein
MKTLIFDRSGKREAALAVAFQLLAKARDNFELRLKNTLLELFGDSTPAFRQAMVGISTEAKLEILHEEYYRHYFKYPAMFEPDRARLDECELVVSEADGLIYRSLMNPQPMMLTEIISVVQNLKRAEANLQCLGKSDA